MAGVVVAEHVLHDLHVGTGGDGEAGGGAALVREPERIAGNIRNSGPPTRPLQKLPDKQEMRGYDAVGVSQASAAVTIACVPVSRVGCTNGAKYGEWLTGMSWAMRPAASAVR